MLNSVLPVFSVLFALLVYLASRRLYKSTGSCTDSKATAIPSVPYRNLLYVGTLGFFVDASSFFSTCMKWSTGRMFSFKVLSDTVIVVRGFTGRDIFLAKGLDFLAGYKLLVPQLKEFLPLKPLTGDESWGAVMASFICTRMIEKFHGTMLGAIAAGYDAWGDEGTLDLFRSVNEIVFAVSLPLAGCQHFAKDAEAIRTLIDIFARLDAGSGPSSLILPWVPTPARVNRVLAGLQLYRITKNLVQERQRLGVDVDDPLQTLIRQNYPTSEMARFIATILFASVTNTANLFAWTLVYLELHKEWKDRVNSEVTTFLQDTGLHASQNLRDDMAYVPLSLMDEKLHTIELVINEVLRLLASGPFIRRNIGDDLVVDGVHIPKGAFIMFPVEDLHRNPEMFPNPDVFDPTRFTAENVEQRKKYGTTFLGWGGGRHPCVGKRTALLEIKMMTILLMAQYQFSLTDVTDSPLCEIPRVDVDRLFKVFGSKEVVNIRYRAKDR